jgi:ribosome-binding protein aMBF1 (putative translation factor)
MEEKILVRVKIRLGSTKQLAGEFKVCKNTVSRAVNGWSNNTLAQEIRKAAVALGGDPIFGKIIEPQRKWNSILAQRFGVTTQAVRNARKGITKTELAEKIRQAATELGGNVNYENINI